jgi:hypothetical protein
MAHWANQAYASKVLILLLDIGTIATSRVTAKPIRLSHLCSNRQYKSCDIRSHAVDSFLRNYHNRATGCLSSRMPSHTELAKKIISYYEAYDTDAITSCLHDDFEHHLCPRSVGSSIMNREEYIKWFPAFKPAIAEMKVSIGLFSLKRLF